MFENYNSSSILYKIKKQPINWKKIHKITQDNLSDPTTQKILTQQLIFHKLSLVDLRTVPKILIKKYLTLNKLVLDHYEAEWNEYKAQLSQLEYNKSLNFLKKIQIDSRLNAILPKLNSLSSIYYHNNQIVNSIYKEVSLKNVGKIEISEIKPCNYCKKVFKNMEFCKMHIKRRHSSEKPTPSVNTSRVDSLEKNLFEDFKNFTNSKIEELLNASQVHLDSIREIQINSQTTNSTLILTQLENEYKGKIEELEAFKNKKIRESQIFKLEYENELLRLRKNIIDRDSEILIKSRIQSFSVEKSQKSGLIRKDKWEKWINKDISYKKTEKVEIQSLDPEKFPESFKVQVSLDQQSLKNSLDFKSSLRIQNSSPNISIIPKQSSAFNAESPENISKSLIFQQSSLVNSLESRLSLLFSPATKHSPDLPESIFPLSHIQFTSTRSLLIEKLNICTAQLKTSITNLELTLKLVSKTFKNSPKPNYK